MTQQDAATGGKRLVPIGLLAVGLLVGSAAGAVVAGPLLGRGEKGSAQAAEAAKPAADPAGDGEEDHAEGGAPGGKYVVDDLVLNPAGTEGTRFLMATVALHLGSAADEEQLKARDEELRDVVLGVLGQKTVGELVQPDSARAALKRELRDSVAGLFPKGTVRRVYLPKFVIQ